jgi:hypothetical protein
VTSARIVSETFFFDFSHATCSGRRKTATRSVDLARGAGPPSLLFFFAAITTSS